MAKKEQKKNDRVIVIFGEITDEKITDITQRIFRLWSEDRAEKITFYINSGGGAVSASLGFYEFIRVLDINLETIGIGKVSSMALILWLSGKTRKASRLTTFLMHELSRNWERPLSLQASELERLALIDRREQGLIDMIIAEKTARSIEAIRERTKLDTPMDIHEAITFGFLDEESVI